MLFLFWLPPKFRSFMGHKQKYSHKFYQFFYELLCKYVKDHKLKINNLKIINNLSLFTIHK